MRSECEQRGRVARLSHPGQSGPSHCPEISFPLQTPFGWHGASSFPFSQNRSPREIPSEDLYCRMAAGPSVSMPIASELNPAQS